jgi:hypothetical protein
MPAKQTLKQKFYDCPRCHGSGTFTLVSAPDAPEDEGFECSEGCKACNKTGRVTPKSWDYWCRVVYGEPSRINWERETERVATTNLQAAPAAYRPLLLRRIAAKDELPFDELPFDDEPKS